jgi:hypothetical protein
MYRGGRADKSNQFGLLTAKPDRRASVTLHENHAVAELRHFEGAAATRHVDEAKAAAA